MGGLTGLWHLVQWWMWRGSRLTCEEAPLSHLVLFWLYQIQKSTNQRPVYQSSYCSLHCVKKHPLTFSIITPAFLGRFLYFFTIMNTLHCTHLMAYGIITTSHRTYKSLLHGVKCEHWTTLLKITHFYFDYNCGISWSIFIFFCTETGMNILQRSWQNLHQPNCVSTLRLIFIFFKFFCMKFLSVYWQKIFNIFTSFDQDFILKLNIFNVKK